MTDVPPVSAVADVLALWGLDGWLTPPLMPVVAPEAPLAGPALTVRLGPGSGGLGPLYEVLSKRQPDAVMVVAAATVIGAAWGEILATAAKSAGLAAAVIDGATRDHGALSAIGVPTYSHATAVVGPNGNACVLDIGGITDVAGVAVAAGDLMVADADGCVRIPAASAGAVLDAARQYAAAEAQVLEALAAGTPLAEAYAIKRQAVQRLTQARR